MGVKTRIYIKEEIKKKYYRGAMYVLVLTFLPGPNWGSYQANGPPGCCHHLGDPSPKEQRK